MQRIPLTGGGTIGARRELETVSAHQIRQATRISTGNVNSVLTRSESLHELILFTESGLVLWLVRAD